MSLVSSLFTGVSGLQSHGSSMQVIGNNIANVSTVGFKSSRAEFADLLSRSAVGAAGDNGIGRGVVLNNVSRSFTQGSFSNTDRLTDLGISGNGFFVLQDAQSGAQFFTRNGQFTTDSEGFLVNNTGLRVQGDLLDTNGNSLGQGDIQFDAVAAQPRPTSDGVNGGGVSINLNLDSREAAIPGGFDPTSASTAEATSNFSTNITVFDSLGNGHAMTVYFTKTQDADPVAGQNAVWEWNATVDGAEVTGGTEGVPFVGASGQLEFNTDGALVDEAITTAAPQDAGWDFVGATADQLIGFDFGRSLAEGGPGFGGSTQFASPTTVSRQTQDGFGAGSLSSISIDADGTVVGFFTNGQTQPIARMVLADFANEQGLRGVGDSLFAESTDSGLPIIGNPDSGGFGAVNTFTLELSNVDLATEFVSLVTTQRAYQANSRIITTVDQLLSDVVNIIR